MSLLGGTARGREHPHSGPGLLLTTTLVVAVLAGIGLRIWILASPLGTADSDEAVVGLMARHLLRGDIYAFYWGQAHGGIQEPILVAGVFALFGSSVLALKLVPVALGVVTALLVWAVGRRTIGEPGARIAAVLSWAAPTVSVWFSTKERGFYGIVNVLSLTVVLLAVRLRDNASPRDAAALGFASGFGWYASPQVGYVVVPCLGWLVVMAARTRRSDLLRLWWVAALGALIGALPWVAANIHSDWASLIDPPPGIRTSYLDRLELFFKTGLPILLGLKVPFGGHWILPAAGPVLYLAALTGFVYAAIRWHDRRVTALLVIVAAYPFLVSVPSASFFMIVPRYLLYLWPVLALLVARATRSAGARVQAATVVGIVTLSVIGTSSLMTWSRRPPGAHDLAAGELRPLVRLLRNEKVETAFAEYWVAYRINFETKEQVTAASLGQVRHPPYQERVRSSDRPAYVLFRGSGPDSRLGPALDQLAVRHRRMEAGRYAVYLPEATVLPESVPAVW